MAAAKKIKILLLIEQISVAYKYFENLAAELSTNDLFEIEIFNLCADEAVNEKLSKVCRRLYTLPKDRPYKKQLLAVCRIIRNCKADIIHAHETIPAFYGAMALMLNFSFKKLIFHRHHSYYRDTAIHFMERIAFVRCNLSISVSQTSLEQAQREHPSGKKKMTLIYNGVTLKDTGIPLPIDISQFNNKLVLVAWFVEGKGHELAMDAINIVRQTVPDVTLFFAGDGDIRTHLEELIIAKKLEQHVIILGAVNNMYSLLSQVDISILPSKAEAFNLSILETFAAKKLSIASDLPSIRECITDKQTGVLIDSSEPQQLASEIIYYLQHPDERNRIAENGFRKYHSDFTTEIMSEHIGGCYKKLVKLT